jgi:hypothetical protein
MESVEHSTPGNTKRMLLVPPSLFRRKYPPSSLVAKKQTATSGTTPFFAMLSAIIKSGSGQIYHCQMEGSARVNSVLSAISRCRRTHLITITFFLYPSLQLVMAHTETLHTAL